MSGISGGDPSRYTRGTVPGTVQGQADKDAYDRIQNNSSGYTIPASPVDYSYKVPTQPSARPLSRSQALVRLIILAAVIYAIYWVSSHYVREDLFTINPDGSHKAVHN